MATIQVMDSRNQILCRRVTLDTRYEVELRRFANSRYPTWDKLIVNQYGNKYLVTQVYTVDGKIPPHHI